MKQGNLWFTMGYKGDPNCFEFEVNGARFKAVRLLFPMGQYDSDDKLSIFHTGGYDNDGSPIFSIMRNGIDRTYGRAGKIFQEISISIAGVDVKSPTDLDGLFTISDGKDTLDDALRAARPDRRWSAVEGEINMVSFPYAFAGQRGCAEVYAIFLAAKPK